MTTSGMTGSGVATSADVTADYSLVIDATAIHPQSGGAGTYVRALVSALSNEGRAPTVIARRHDTYEWPGAAVVHRVAPSPRPLRMLWEHIGLARFVDRVMPAGTVVLHSPHYTSPFKVPARFRRVVTIHDLTFFSRPQDHARTKRVLFRRAITTSATRADAIVAVSRTTAAHYRTVTGRSERVFCAPHGVDHNRFFPLDHDKLGAEAQRRVDRSLLDEPDVRSPFIAFLGTIEPRKQVPELLRAYEIVRKEEPDVGLVLAGQQWPGVELPPLQPGERRLGFVTDELAVALLRSAAVVAYPSAEEGFGMPLIEAMACGALVVAAASAVSIEVCGAAARLVELNPPPTFASRLASSLLDALRDEPGDAAARRMAAVERSKAFSWESSARSHLDAYAAASSSNPLR